MPYPNEHACRLRAPSDFEAESFRRVKSGKVSIIIGKLKGKSETTAQAIRYPKSDWSAAEARSNCEDKGGSFEAAAAQEMSSEAYLGEIDNPLIPHDEKLSADEQAAINQAMEKKA